MNVTITIKDTFQDILCSTLSGTSYQKIGQEKTWTIYDQDSSFEFVEACGNLALTKCTINFPISQEFTAFINYLDLFYNLDTSYLKDTLLGK